MDQPDQVRQPKGAQRTWLAHRGPMGKRPPTGASVPTTHNFTHYYEALAIELIQVSTTTKTPHVGGVMSKL